MCRRARGTESGAGVGEETGRAPGPASPADRAPGAGRGRGSPPVAPPSGEGEEPGVGMGMGMGWGGACLVARGRPGEVSTARMTSLPVYALCRRGRFTVVTALKGKTASCGEMPVPDEVAGRAAMEAAIRRFDPFYPNTENEF